MFRLHGLWSVTAVLTAASMLGACCPTPTCVTGRCTTGVANTTQQVDPTKELLIRDLSVVESTRATDPKGPWSFGGLIERMRGNVDASKFVVEWLKTWTVTQTVNGDVVGARNASGRGIREQIIEPWKVRDGQPGVDDDAWQVNLANAPFRLLAIVNRLDLRHTDEAQVRDAGEGRFVFGVLGENGQALRFTVIFEYELPAATCDEVAAWVKCWHSLGALPFGEEYNAALEKVTERFTKPGASISKPNRSALNQIRTNEIALADPWELREFNLSSNSGLLRQVTVKQTPAQKLDGQDEATLLRFLQENSEDILNQAHTVPMTFHAAAFRGGASLVPDPSFRWTVAGADQQVLNFFSLNTCNGCHGGTTGTQFLHVAPREPGQVAQLSAFLTGDLQQRAAFLTGMLADGEGICRGGVTAFRSLGADTKQSQALPAVLRNRTPPARVH